MLLIKLFDAAFGYDNNIVVSDLNFEINQGDHLYIIGENGSGKSTLLKGLLRLKKPSSGRILFADILKKEGTGFIPQQSQIQRDFPAKVKEIVLSGCLSRKRFNPFYSKSDENRASCNMELLGIKEIAGVCYSELSGGQQQRVLLARALCAAESILILDEPATGLDSLVTSDLYNLVSEINQEKKITVIVVSHDIEAAYKYSSHILHLGNRQLFFGTKNEYFNSELAAFSKAASSNRFYGREENS